METNSLKVFWQMTPRSAANVHRLFYVDFGKILPLVLQDLRWGQK
jgi:hypothetical protein